MCLVGTLFLLSSDTKAYENQAQNHPFATEIEWHANVLRVRGNIQSCVDRGVGTPFQIEQAFRGAVALWNHGHANLAFEYVGTTTSFVDGDDPIPIFCATPAEAPVLSENPNAFGYALAETSILTITPPFIDVEIDRCQIGINADKMFEYDAAGHYSGPGATSLLDVTAHELGHCAGFLHENDVPPPGFLLMRGGFIAISLYTEDEQLGLIAFYGANGTEIRTAKATLAANQLVFEPQQGLGILAIGSPAASGNPDTSGPFDYAVAWLAPHSLVASDPTARTVVVATFREEPGGLVELTRRVTPFQSVHAPSVAIGKDSSILIAFIPPGDPNGYQRLATAVSLDQGLSWLATSLSQSAANGPAAVTYSPVKERFLLAYVLEPATSLGYQVATLVSTNAFGSNWTGGGIYGPSVVTPRGRVGVACSHHSGRCLIVYRQYAATGDVSQITQKAVTLQLSGDHYVANPLDTFPLTVNSTVGEPSLTRFAAGYMLAFPSRQNGFLRHRIKLDSGDSTEITPWSASQSPTLENTSIRSRVRIESVYNWRTGDFRVFWRKRVQ